MREAKGKRRNYAKTREKRNLKNEEKKGKERDCVFGCVFARENAFYVKLGCDFTQLSRFGTKQYSTVSHSVWLLPL